MSFIELDRDFVPLDADQSYRAEVFDGLRLSSWSGLKWPALLEHERVVVLAEAASGKSEEFRQRCASIRKAGGFSLYLPIERLEKNGLVGSLGVVDLDAFRDWQRDVAPGWFFLDSIDEARVHHKDVEVALNRFAVDLGEAYDRARIFLSCRGSVWAGGRDLALVNLALPIRPRPEPDRISNVDHDAALLDVQQNRLANAREAAEPPKRELRLVALAKITRSQRNAFLTAEKVSDVEQFEQALFKSGLYQLAERPGDLRLLVRYWGTHGGFGDLTDMIEFGIVERLAETGDARRDVIGISDLEARHGVERIAAAMTLGQTMDLVLPDLADGDTAGIDPYRVLDDWNPRDVDGLLQRGVFVPSSFGRLRFYHRSVQEYLTASWFKRLKPGLTDSEMYRIFLGSGYGIETIPPSLRAAAAWIAPSHQGLREHILAREPHILLAEGDPKRLLIADRAHLLEMFARRQLAGDSTHRLIDHQALWMFADDRLSLAIRKALSINPRADFRFEMLRLIQQGRLADCRDILLETALDRGAGVYHRIVAADALAEIGDLPGLKALARDILADPTPLPARLAPSLATLLFPQALNVDELLKIIATSQPARRYQVEGFNRELLSLYEQCPNEAARRKLIGGLAELAFAPPLGDWPKISERNAVLVSKFAGIAKAAVARSDRAGTSPELLALLRAAHRAHDEDRDEGPTLEQMIADRPALNQALFWQDVADARAASDKPVTRLPDISPDGPPLWQIDSTDTAWLVRALTRSDPDDRLIALDTLIRVAFGDDDPNAKLNALQKRVKNDAALLAAIIDARTPRAETEEDIRRREKWAGIDRIQKEREEQRRERWRKVRTKLQADPRLLSDPQRLARWPGPYWLLEVTRWATKHSATRDGGVPDWKRLEAAFGLEIAAEYRSGMKTLWRVTRPERPKENADGGRTVKHSIILSVAGIVIEAAERADWAEGLTPAEAARAARHICLDDQIIPEALGALLVAHPTAVSPFVAREVAREWRSSDLHTPFLDRVAHRLPIASLDEALIVLVRRGSKNPARIATASDLVLRLALTDADRAMLARKALREMKAALAVDDEEMWGAQLRLLFRVAPEVGALELISIVDAALRANDMARAQALFRRFFDRHRGSVVDPAVLGARLLGRLLELSYAIRQAPVPVAGDDEDDDEIERREAIDDPLNELLSALLRVEGEEAYRTMLALSENPVVGDSGHRLRELARELAERGAERPPWDEAQVRPFETNKLAPITTGADLFELVCALLDAINWRFAKADMSSRAVIETAENEAAVQEWLGETLETAGQRRFQVHREAQVAQEKRPDLIVTATTAPVEVAIEIKHDEKGWSLKELRNALDKQLAEQYLQPANRRHGILAITNHRDAKFWRDTVQGARLGFEEVVIALQAEAARLRSNSSGSIEVAVRGIDAAPRRRDVAAVKDKRSSNHRMKAT